MKKHFLTLLLLVPALVATQMQAQRIQQQLGRGVVAVDRTWNSSTRFGDKGKLISWRKLAQEPENTKYNVYSRGKGSSSWTRIASNLSKTNYTPSSLAANTEYAVSAVIDGVEGEKSAPFLYTTHPWPNVWFQFDFDNTVLERDNYRTKFTWPMDLNGDGEFDAIVVDRLYAGAGEVDADDDGNAVDLTTSHKIQGYKLDGTLLWTVDIGPNINICGGQNDMVVAYDINCDGKCEVMIRSSDGTRFWDKTNNTWGKYANGSSTADTDGDGIVDYSNQSSKLPPFYISVIDGETGEEIDCNELDYSTVHDGTDTWTRNSRGNYMSFSYATLEGHFSICYLDGIHPSLVMECLDRDTGKTHHNYVFTWDYTWTNGNPSNWHHSNTWSRNDKSPWPAEFHQLRVADVDGDGFDEMVQGGYNVNPLKGTFHSPGIAHGDRWILSDIDPDRPGMECYAIQQYALLGQLIYDPATGERLKEWYLPSVYDVGRGACMDIDPNHKGYELYSFTDDYIYNGKGEPTGETRSQWGIGTMFEGVWWNDDLLREELSSPGGSNYGTNLMVTTVRGKSRQIEFSQESFWGAHAAVGTRPAFMGDIIGDWREEIILAVQNESSSTGLVGYTTAIPTDYSIYCLQQDPHYRLDCTTRGYYQHPNTSFYLGVGMPTPPLPPVMQADLRYKSGNWTQGASSFTTYDQKQAEAYADGKSVIFDVSGNNSSPITIGSDVRPSVTYFINPLKHDYTLNGNIAGGKVFKSQLGTTTINGNITSSDSLIISEGTLVVNGTITAPLSLKAKGTLAGNAILDGTSVFEGGLNYEGCRLSPGTGTEPFGTFTFNKDLTLTGDVFVEINLKTADGANNDKIKVNGDLTLKKTNTISFVLSESTPAEGTYTLMECTGTLTADPAQILVRGLVGLNYAIEAEDGKLQLTIRGTREPAEGVTWTGAESNVWDYQTANFTLNGEPTTFVAGDKIIFPDGAEQQSIIISDLMVTNGVEFTNDKDTYTFSGEGGFSGTGDLLVSGKGTVNLQSAKSDYTGKTIINAGTVTVTSLENGGTPCCLGAGKIVSMGKGTLTVNHTNAATNRSFTLTDTATINIPTGTLTLQSAVKGNNGTLQKKGSGQLNLSYGGANSYKETILIAGTISQGAWNTTIGKAGSPIHVKGNASLRIFNVNSSSTVPEITNIITIDNGKTLTVSGGQRCKMGGSILGAGTLAISFPYVRGDFYSNLSNFTGTLNITSGEFHITSALQLSNGTLTLGAGASTAGYNSQSSTLTNMTHKMGALTSTATDCTLYTGTWNVGYLNTNCTYAGTFSSAATINKYGTGILTLSGASEGAINIYEGEVEAKNTAKPITTGTITIQNGGLLGGSGQVKNVIVQNGGTIAAGKTSSILVGKITITGNLTVNADGNIRVRTRSTATRTNTDVFTISGNATLTSPVIQVSQMNSDYNYVPDTDIKFIDCTGNITINGDVTIQPAEPMPGYKWDTSDLNSGIIRVVVDPTAITNISADEITADDAVFDISGRRIGRISKSGVYVINGKKIYVKK